VCTAGVHKTPRGASGRYDVKGLWRRLDNGVAVVFGDASLATFRVFYIDPAVMDSGDAEAGRGTQQQQQQQQQQEEEVELRGATFDASSITPKSTIIGEGNYGEVFQVHTIATSLSRLSS
jgi:hypothetical protein